jgi:hypothetical protein
MKSLPILIVSALLVATAAKADFAILPASPPADPPAASEPALSAPAGLHPASSAPPDKPTARGKQIQDHHGFRIAQGFGNQIPLSFAIRQIVPARVKVRFAGGTDHEALVDWHGGQPWPSALRAAIRPLGLRLSVHRHSVIISDRRKN